MEQPLVSIVIPFYSGANWLKEAVDSVLNQTYKNVEVLIINDGSLENIDDISKEFRPVIKIFNKKNGGPASARNLGIDKASGKYIAFLDSDDLWLPDKLLKQIGYMELSNYVWSQHSYEMFWEDSDKTKLINTKVYSGDVYRQCFISFKVQTSCVVVLRSILIDNHIRFPIEKRYGQDGDFYRQLAKDFSLGFVEGVLSKFRIRGTNAGFRAKVQLDDKALTWNEIKNNYLLLNILPKPVIYAYQISEKFSSTIDWISKNLINNSGTIELISKVMYSIPYSIFKVYSRKPW